MRPFFIVELEVIAQALFSVLNTLTILSLHAAQLLGAIIITM